MSRSVVFATIGMADVMHSGGICAERDRLFHKATAAVKAHNQFSSQAATVMAPDKTLAEECAVLRVEMRAAFLAAQAAWQEYREHVQEHGC